jgi:hypothetical protein
MKPGMVEPVAARHAGGTFLGGTREGVRRPEREGQDDES